MARERCRDRSRNRTSHTNGGKFEPVVGKRSISSIANLEWAIRLVFVSDFVHGRPTPPTRVQPVGAIEDQSGICSHILVGMDDAWGNYYGIYLTRRKFQNLTLFERGGIWAIIPKVKPKVPDS